MTRTRAALLAAPAVLFLLVLLAVPYAGMVAMSLRAAAQGGGAGTGWTVAHYARALGTGVPLAALGRSLAMGVAVASGTLVLAYPLALHLARAGRRAHVLFYAAVVSPLLLGVLVRNFGWLIILAPNGPVNAVLVWAGLLDRPARLLFTPGAVWLALVHVFLPFMVLPLAAALRNTPDSLREASDSLGAGSLRTFWSVTLPLSFPGLRTGVVLVFVLATGAYVTPALIGGGVNGPVMPQLIVAELVGSFAWPYGAALALVLAAATLACAGLFAAATSRLHARTAP